MSLQKILLDIASEVGVSISNAEERLWATKMVNDAAKEIYESADLVGSLREITINIDTDAQNASMISLPGYVDQIRGIKYSAILGGKIPQNDQRPRYHYGRGWGSNAISLPIRVVRESAPLKRDISNASLLVFTIPIVESSDIVITIVGQTTNSNRVSEKVTIVAGTLTVATLGNFIDVVNIEKDTVNVNDITVTDIDDNILSVIPNHQIKPLYKWLELTDNNVLGGQTINTNIYTAIDILYKPFFEPFVELFDEFQAGPKYDRAIFYKFQELYFAQQDGKETKAIVANSKVTSLLDSIGVDTDQARTMEVEWGRNGLSDAQNPHSPLTWNRRH